jgi:hypothetical protein
MADLGGPCLRILRGFAQATADGVDPLAVSYAFPAAAVQRGTDCIALPTVGE